jgi:predicted ATPase
MMDSSHLLFPSPPVKEVVVLEAPNLSSLDRNENPDGIQFTINGEESNSSTQDDDGAFDINGSTTATSTTSTAETSLPLPPKSLAQRSLLNASNAFVINKNQGELEEYTSHKLRFGTELYGRDKEIKLLKDLYQQVSGSPIVAASIQTSTVSTDPANQPKDLGQRGQEGTSLSTSDVTLEAGNAPRQHSGTHQPAVLYTKQVVLIAGEPGSGKSALAGEVMKKCSRRNGGCFLTGKFSHDEMESDGQSDNAALSSGSHGKNASKQKPARPFSAIADACSRFIDDLLLLYDSETDAVGGTSVYDSDCESCTESLTCYPNAVPLWRFQSNESRDGWKKKRDVAILETIIPNIGRLIGSQSFEINSEDAEASSEAKNDFAASLEGSMQAVHYAFRRFFFYLCQYSFVVLVLDDLQWADGASLELLESLLLDETLKTIMFVGTIRNDDHANFRHLRTNAAHAVEFFSRIQEQSAALVTPVAFTEVRLEKLAVIDVTKWLESLLNVDDDEAKELAEVVHGRTNGNPLYAKEFMRTLKQMHLLTYDYTTLKWKFDIDAIIEQTSSTLNVVDFVTSRMSSLSEACQSLLPKAACLGPSFSYKIFEVVARDDVRKRYQDKATDNVKEMDLKSKLNELVAEGIFERDRKRQIVKWSHDKIRESALNLVGGNCTESVRLQLGILILSQFPEPETSADMYTIVNLLNSVSVNVLPASIKSDLCKLNLAAGDTALQSSFFTSASRYFRNGVDLLPANEDERWHESISVTLGLLSGSAEAHFCIGQHGRVREIFEEVSNRRDIPLLDKRRIFDAYIYSLSAQSRSAEALDLSLDTLKKLGCRFPKFLRSFRSMIGIIMMQRNARKRTEQIRRLGVMRDKQKQWIIHLLYRSVVFAYQVDPDIFPMVLLEGMRCTLQYGIADDAAPILATFGLVVSGVLGDFEGGRDYATLALSCATRKTEARTKVIACEFVLHQLSTYESIKEPLIEGYEAGMRSGDLESGFWSIFFFLEIQIFSSSHLQGILRDCDVYTHQMEMHKQTKVLMFTRFVFQLAYNLAHQCSGGCILTGSIMDESQIIQDIKGKAEHIQDWMQLHRFKTHAAFWFGEHERVCGLIEDQKFHKYQLEHLNPGFPGIAPLYLQCALSCVSMYRNTGKANHKRRALKFYSKIKTWAGKGNRNLQHAEALLRAELDDISGRNNPGHDYEIAILMARRFQLISDEAICHERFADFCWTNGKLEGAKYHYNRSLQLYRDWGAHGKVKQLEESLLKRHPDYASIEAADSSLIF